jgi:2-C-methyl-D-erythritol 2,4-cyclodiphosphate synthase
MYRVGIGFDLHRLTERRPLVLGGVAIDYRLGLEGHSDADVLLHALMDALLGAAGLRDIGFYFPPGDPRFLNASSLLLLREVKSHLDAAGYRVVNTDTVVIAEEPKIAPYSEAIRANIAAVLDLPAGSVSVKATTTEGLGACGRGEAIAVQAVVLLCRG